MHVPFGLDVVAVAGKDLKVEWRTRAVVSRILPFGVVLVLLFAAALDPDRGTLPAAAPGLFWSVVLLASLLCLGESFAAERANGAGESLLLSGIDPGAMFVGKTLAVVAELLLLEVVLGVCIAATYDVAIGPPAWVLLTAAFATTGIASAGVLYAAAAASDSRRESLLPMLLLPALLPVLLGATRATEHIGAGDLAAAMPWMQLLAVFALAHLAVGVAAFGSLFEEV